MRYVRQILHPSCAFFENNLNLNFFAILKLFFLGNFSFAVLVGCLTTGESIDATTLP